jgi:hypothetical protein
VGKGSTPPRAKKYFESSKKIILMIETIFYE